MDSTVIATRGDMELNEHAVPDMSVVIVCWNNKGYLEPCLASLYQSGMRSSFEVIVVDNGSTDGTPAMVRQRFPEVCLIQNDRNMGLSRASNQGMQAARGRYNLLLNDDTLVNGPSLDAMVSFMDAHPDAGAVGGRLLNPDGSFQAGFGGFSSLHQEFLVATRLGQLFWPSFPSHGDAGGVKSVDWLSSACLLLRRSALDQVGLLDEEYFIYGDEADLQYRLQQAGWKVYYLPQVATVHYGGRSLNRWRRRRLVYRGKLLFFCKHYGQLRTLLLRLMLASVSMFKAVCWGFAWLMPRWRERARHELASNMDVVRLCASSSQA
jgi:GT2 family glycosyltransferase